MDSASGKAERERVTREGKLGGYTEKVSGSEQRAMREPGLSVSTSQETKAVMELMVREMPRNSRSRGLRRIRPKIHKSLLLRSNKIP